MCLCFREAQWSIKGTFHESMGKIKDRNGEDLIKAEEVKKRWQEYTKKLYKKGLNDSDNHNGGVTHLEPGHSRVWSQVGLRKHHYEASLWSKLVEVMEFQLSYLKS